MKMKLIIVLYLLISCSHQKKDHVECLSDDNAELVVFREGQDSIKTVSHDSLNSQVYIGNENLIDELLNALFIKCDSFHFQVSQDNQLKFILKDGSYLGYSEKKYFEQFKSGYLNYLNTSGLVLIINEGFISSEFKKSIKELNKLRDRADNEKTLYKLKAGFIIASMESYSILIFIDNCSRRNDFLKAVNFLKTRPEIKNLLISHCGFN